MKTITPKELADLIHSAKSISIKVGKKFATKFHHISNDRLAFDQGGKLVKDTYFSQGRWINNADYKIHSQTQDKMFKLYENGENRYMVDLEVQVHNDDKTIWNTSKKTTISRLYIQC